MGVDGFFCKNFSLVEMGGIFFKHLVLYPSPPPLSIIRFGFGRVCKVDKIILFVYKNGHTVYDKDNPGTLALSLKIVGTSLTEKKSELNQHVSIF